MDNIYLTTPIYYASGSPHIGHAYTSIVADVLRRHHEQNNRNSFLLTGTDEHGDKIMRKADEAQIHPGEWVDKISNEFRALLPKINVEASRFIRTTESQHVEAVTKILSRIYDKGDIYLDKYEGLYCVECEDFYSEDELDNGKCPTHKIEVDKYEESNYFFRMSAYQERLIDHINNSPSFIRPKQYRKELLSFLEQPLRDLCISRPKSRLTWGIDLPFDQDYVTYVWFDALTNYISGLGWPRDSENFNKYWPSAHHIVAKDIIKPHGIYWPTMLMAAEIEPYQHLTVHGYWLNRSADGDSHKMSKSLGNVADPLDLVDRYGSDALRYFLLREMQFGSDANFSYSLFVERYNSDLANDIGNLVNRLTKLIRTHRNGRVPALPEVDEESLLGSQSRALQTMGAGLSQRRDQAVETLELHDITWQSIDFVRSINAYVSECAPWKAAKEARWSDFDTCMSVSFQSLAYACRNLWPVMPNASARILQGLGLDIDNNDFTIDRNLTVGEIENQFPRIVVDKEPDRSKIPDPVYATIDDFAKLEFKVGQIVSAEDHPKADKLLVAQVDVGEEKPRQICAGIKSTYTASELSEKRVMVVANLKPAKLRGVLSEGMMLAGDDSDGNPILIEPPSALPIGSVVR